MYKQSIVALVLLLPIYIKAQVFNIVKQPSYNSDSVRAEFDNKPYFSLMKDNYFTVGSDLSGKPNAYNSNLKIQVSISQRLTKSKLPFDSYLFIAYTQRIFWDIFRESAPINEINFNPAIGLSKLLIKDNKYVGKATVMIEHESNGKDGVDSRSLEKLSLVTSMLIQRNWQLQLKGYIPYVDGENNKDIMSYTGYGQAASEYKLLNKRLRLSLVLAKRGGINLNFNTTAEISYKHSKKSNQYFFLHFYNGYGESLNNYKVHSNTLRVGFVIKPLDFSFF